jgi:hypothetical protein
MWVYVQSSGDVFSGCTYVETVYSGALPEVKNTPDMECIRNVDPIRRHYYSIGAETSSPTGMTLQLAPDDPNHYSPRSGFLIQEENSMGTAPQGYIVPSRATRQKVADSDDKRLRVVRDSIWVDSIKRRSHADKLQLV